MLLSSFSLKNSTPIPAAARNELLRLLDDYGRMPEGRWLRTFPYRRFEFLYCPAMAGSDVLGAFLPLHRWNIYLQPFDTSTRPAADGDPRMLSAWQRIADAWVRSIGDTVIHELRHAFQFANSPVLYVLCSLPVVREFTLERDAKKIAAQAEKLVESLNEAYDIEQAMNWRNSL